MAQAPTIRPGKGVFAPTRVLGKRWSAHEDAYHWILTRSWPQFFAIISACFLATNAVFAFAYYLQPGSILNARDASFEDAFFFSVQTMATIGYGKMVPNGVFANILVTVEALIGLGGLAIATGVLFAKLSRPTARVLFSKVAVIGYHDGVTSFVFRIANERSSKIVDPRIKMVLVRDEITVENRKIRRFHDLQLVRDFSPLLVLSWSVYHPINSNSPLYGANSETLMKTNTEIIVSLTGLDETLSQTIHAQHSYIAEEIVCNSHFVDIMSRDENGRVNINYHKFHDVIES